MNERFPGASRVLGYLSSLETTFNGIGEMLLGFICIVFLRSVLEGLLEYEHLLGIRAVPAVSQAMLFLHFPAFYVAVFLLILIIITRITGRGIRPVSGVMLHWWPLLLLPPVFDWIISSGAGYRLGYIFDLRDIPQIIWRFWLPVSLDIQGITPGMRLEISIACIGVGIYIAFTRNIHRGIVGFGITFISLLLLGSIPALAGSAVSDESWITAGGFGNLQSHRFAIIYGVLSGIFGLIVLHDHDRILFNAWVRGFRWLRSGMYAVLPALGFWALYWVFRPWLDYVFLKPGDWISVFGIVICQVVSFQAAALFNDLADEPWDRSDFRGRIFLAQGVQRRRVTFLAWILFAYGVFFALCVQYAVFLIVLLQHLIAWVYSFPPWRLKRIPIVSTLLVSTAAVLSFIAGGAVIGREWIFETMPGSLLLALQLSFILGFGFKDMADANDDKKAGIRSVPVILGMKRSRIFYAISIAASFISFPLISGLSILIVPGFVFGIIGAAIVVKAGVSGERVLISALLISLLVVGFGLRLDARWLAKQRERIAVCMEKDSESFSGSIKNNRIRGWLPASEFQNEIVRSGIDLIGEYPWIIPRLGAVIGFERAGLFLERAAHAGICPGMTHVASLDCFAAAGEPTRWCNAMDGALVWNSLRPDLFAVGGRQADELGYTGTASRLLTHGRKLWPQDASVWAETGRFFLKRGRIEEALHALRTALKNNPRSVQLQADIANVEALLNRQRIRDSVYKGSMR